MATNSLRAIVLSANTVGSRDVAWSSQDGACADSGSFPNVGWKTLSAACVVARSPDRAIRASTLFAATLGFTETQQRFLRQLPTILG